MGAAGVNRRLGRMKLAIDFDGTLVVQAGRKYEDFTTPLELMPGAEKAVRSLKAAGHTLILWSARASPNLLVNPRSVGIALDPEYKRMSHEHFHMSLEVNRGRFRQMLDFARDRMPGVFSFVTSDKMGADVFIDDKALRLSPGPAGLSWGEIALLYGDEMPSP
jgi:hypothetical protein